VGKFHGDVDSKSEINVYRQTHYKQKGLDYLCKQIIRHWAVSVLVLLNSATTLFENRG